MQFPMIRRRHTLRRDRQTPARPNGPVPTVAGAIGLPQHRSFSARATLFLLGPRALGTEVAARSPETSTSHYRSLARADAEWRASDRRAGRSPGLRCSAPGGARHRRTSSTETIRSPTLRDLRCCRTGTPVHHATRPRWHVATSAANLADTPVRVREIGRAHV